MNVKDFRRDNLRTIAKHIGGISILAKKLQRSQGRISAVIGKNPCKHIGNQLARHIEQQLGLLTGMLDLTPLPIINRKEFFCNQHLLFLPMTKKLSSSILASHEEKSCNVNRIVIHNYCFPVGVKCCAVTQSSDKTLSFGKVLWDSEAFIFQKNNEQKTVPLLNTKFFGVITGILIKES